LATASWRVKRCTESSVPFPVPLRRGRCPRFSKACVAERVAAGGRAVYPSRSTTRGAMRSAGGRHPERRQVESNRGPAPAR
jgi:hypothetical protein